MSEGRRFARPKSIKNWRAYNEGLKKRYDITVHLNPEVLKKPPQIKGQRGRPQEYGAALIEMLLVVKAVYRLPYRGLEGFARSLLAAGTRLPDYTTLCVRAATANVALDVMRRDEPVHLVVDTTGLKVYGEGEWKVRMHGYGKRRTWRKLHLAVDEATQEIVAVDLTERRRGDPEHLPALLDQVPAHVRLKQVTGDGAYDTYACHETARHRGAALIAPPRQNALALPGGRPPKNEHPRLRTLRDCRRRGRTAWKKHHGYHRRSLAETAMYRFKTSFGDRLISRASPQQKTEALVKSKTLNLFRRLATPSR